MYLHLYDGVIGMRRYLKSGLHRTRCQHWVYKELIVWRRQDVNCPWCIIREMLEESGMTNYIPRKG